MPEITLTNGMIAIVDESDMDILSSRNWYAQKNKDGGVYATAKNGTKTVYMHRFLLGIKDRKIQVDHANKDTLDNRRINLRPCNSVLNGANKHKLISPKTTSRFKGVSWNKMFGRWTARIKIDGKDKYLGAFKSEEEAALAYDKEAVKKYGEFYSQNFPTTMLQDKVAA